MDAEVRLDEVLLLGDLQIETLGLHCEAQEACRMLKATLDHAYSLTLEAARKNADPLYSCHLWHRMNLFCSRLEKTMWKSGEGEFEEYAACLRARAEELAVICQARWKSLQCDMDCLRGREPGC